MGKGLYVSLLGYGGSRVVSKPTGSWWVRGCLFTFLVMVSKGLFVNLMGYGG